jgi:hypothetical protein
VASKYSKDAQAKDSTAYCTRLGGKNRFATSVLINQEAIKLKGTIPTEAMLAAGDNFPDALSAGTIAGQVEIPLLISKSKTLATETAAFLKTHTSINTVIILGSTTSISDTVKGQLEKVAVKTVPRWGGTSRLQTNQIIIQNAQRRWAASNPTLLAPATLGLASSNMFPDALAAAAALCHTKGVLILTPKTSLQPTPSAIIRANAGEAFSFNAYGSTSSLSSAVRASYKELIS